MTPLTHHEILTLVAPFTRCERHVDLQASDRLERRLAFKPRRHPGVQGVDRTLTEHLVLENPEEGKFRLTRTLTDPAGLSGSLRAEGADPARLLRQIDEVPPHSQFAVSGHFAIAFSYGIAADGDGADQAGGGSQRLLTEALAVAGDTWIGFDFKAFNASRIPIRIRSAKGQVEQLPKDLFAILGPAWHRLQADDDAWTGNLYVPAREPRRTEEGELKVAQTAAHLAATLAQPPAQFHRRHQQARWRVVLRNILALVGLLAAMAVAPVIVSLTESSIITTLAYFWYPALLLAMPFIGARVELVPPSWPRPLPETAWRPPSARTDGGGQERPASATAPAAGEVGDENGVTRLHSE